MITIRRYDDLRIPDYALSYLVNGDDSGLDEQDKKNIDSYMKNFYNVLNDEEFIIFAVNQECKESYFTWHPAFGLACSVIDCTILIVK